MDNSKTFFLAQTSFNFEWLINDFNCIFAKHYSCFIKDSVNSSDFKITIEIKQEKKLFPANKNANWSINKIDTDFFSFIVKSRNNAYVYNELIFSFTNNNWKLIYYDIECKQKPIRFNPFTHPLGTLIFQYALINKNSFYIHGSGVNYNGQGLIFTGKSGFGKTTMSDIFHNGGMSVINDDRLIIRKIADSYMMFNSPLKNVTEPKQSRINHIFSIYHSKKNIVEKISGIEAFRKVVPNIIQHNVDKAFVSILSDTYSDFIKRFPVYSLGFVPDKNIIPFISDIIN